MSGILGLRLVTRLRYGSPTYTGLDPVRPAPTSTPIQASIDVAPRSRWAPDASGQLTIRTYEVITRSELRGADDGGQTYADRLVSDGRTYEVQEVIRMDPFEGDPVAHYEAVAVEVQPLGDEVPAAVAATNTIPPSILGTRGATLTAWPGIWAGSTPITFAYSWLVDEVEVGTGATYNDDGNGVVVLQVTATNGTSPAGVAESQPLAELAP